MTINEKLGNPLFLAYKSTGPTSALITPAVVLNILGYSGVLMNAFVFFTTIKTKSLHGTTHFLLALISFCEILHQSGHIIFLYISLSGINFIDSFTLAMCTLQMLFGMSAALFGIMLVSIDRFFALILPQLHTKFGGMIYLSLMTISCFLYGIYSDFLLYNFAKNNPDIPMTGLIADLLLPLNDLAYCNEILNGITIFIYLLLCIIVKSKKGVTNGTNMRLMKSVAIIVSINIGGYLIGTFVLFQLITVLRQFMDFIALWHFGIYFPGMAVNIGAACNAPVLYMTSSEYRKAFSLYLKKLAQILRIQS